MDMGAPTDESAACAALHLLASCTHSTTPGDGRRKRALQPACAPADHLERTALLYNKPPPLRPTAPLPVCEERRQRKKEAPLRPATAYRSPGPFRRKCPSSVRGGRGTRNGAKITAVCQFRHILRPIVGSEHVDTSAAAAGGQRGSAGWAAPALPAVVVAWAGVTGRAAAPQGPARPRRVPGRPCGCGEAAHVLQDVRCVGGHLRRHLQLQDHVAQGAHSGGRPFTTGLLGQKLIALPSFLGLLVPVPQHRTSGSKEVEVSPGALRAVPRSQLCLARLDGLQYMV